MIEQHKDIKTDLLRLGVDVVEVDYNQRGFHLEVMLNVDQVYDFAQKMYEKGFYLVFVAGLQVQPEEKEGTRTSGLAVIYQFARYDMLCRVKGHVFLPENKTVPSICDIYQGANWHERETRDMFGIIFSGHPNLKPLLLAEEDQDYHPLLKAEENLKSFEKVSWQPATSENAAAES
jgi:NADH-quinone oxidoreductase subunit C